MSFPDANPTTTPVIAATDPVLVRVVAKNGSDVPDSTTPWSVSAFAGGNLMSGADAIAISNVTWTAVQFGFCLGGCTCLAGTASDLVPQLMILGQGNTDLTLGCLYSFSLANDWSYNPMAKRITAGDGHRDVDMLMRINTDDHRPRFGRRNYAVGHGLASSDCGPELVRVGGQDCDGPWLQQAPIGSRPIRSAGCRTSCQRAMTDRPVARTVGQSS